MYRAARLRVEWKSKGRRTEWHLSAKISRRPVARVVVYRGLPVLVHEVSRRVWGLRLRRTGQELALTLPLMLPSAHYKDVGVRIASFRSSIAHPAYPLSTLRWVPRGSSARLGARWFAIPFL